jgi:predicted DNA-binding transcriptional regulator YafY
MLLQARGRMTAPALAVALEVSQRTVLRDIDQLSAAGVPIWSERGREGGFVLQAGWTTQLTGMTEAEANALMLAGLPGAATELGFGAAAASARLKLLASLPAPWREQADRVGQRLHIDLLDWYRAHEVPTHLREVANAVWTERLIHISYQSWNARVQRELKPLGLILKAGTWYLAAIAKAAPAKRELTPRESTKGSAKTNTDLKVRTYRITNILQIEVSDVRFKRPAQFDLDAYWRDSLSKFHAELNRMQATLAVSPQALTRLTNERAKLTVLPKSEALNDSPAGWQTVLMPIESIEHGARQCLGFGADVVVLEPTALRDKIQSEARAISARYG